MAMPLLINLDQSIAPVMTSLGLHDLVSDFSCQSGGHCPIPCLHPGVLHALAWVLFLPTVLLCLRLAKEVRLAEAKIWQQLGEKADIPVSCSVPYSLFNGAYHYGLLSFKSVKNLFFFLRSKLHVFPGT